MKKQKRWSPKMNDLFTWLEDDMKAIVAWDEDERQKKSVKHTFGYMWLNRALLA